MILVTSVDRRFGPSVYAWNIAPQAFSVESVTDLFSSALLFGFLWLVFASLPALYFWDRMRPGRIRNLVFAIFLVPGIAAGAMWGFFIAAGTLWGSVVALPGIVLSLLVCLLVGGAVRALYLPIQFIRHQSALREADALDAELEARAAAGNSSARVSLASARSPDPHKIPWYRW